MTTNGVAPTFVDALRPVELSAPSGARVVLYRHGAHVASWQLPDGDDVLFLSRDSRFAPGVPIRGGIPLVFPQFSKHGPLPQHGFARSVPWRLEEVGQRSAGEAFARLILTDSEVTRELWPHEFVAELEIILALDLTIRFTVRNTGDRAFTFTTALHTYFRVGDIRRVRVEGLEGASFVGTEPGGEPRPVSDPLEIERETDGVYAGAPDQIRIRDDSLGRTIVIEKRGFADAVVWNPWIDRARAMTDFGDEEYRQMLCVEPGNIAEPTQLGPGGEWVGSQTITVHSIA